MDRTGGNVGQPASPGAQFSLYEDEEADVDAPLLGEPSSYLEVTASAGTETGGYMTVEPDKAYMAQRVDSDDALLHGSDDDELVDLPMPPTHAPGLTMGGAEDDDLLQVEDAKSVSSRDLSQRDDIGFSRGVGTPPPVSGGDDELAGYAEVTPVSYSHSSGGGGGGGMDSGGASRAAEASSPSMDRPLTFSGGTLPDDFLRLTVPVEVPLQSGGGMYQGELGAVPSGGLLIIYVAEAKLTKNYGIGRMDPFVRLTSSGCRINSTVAVSGAKSPMWHKQTKLQIPMILDSMLKVEVLSMGTFSDRLVGWTDIDIEPALCGRKMEDWFPLSGKQGVDKEGVINLVIGFRPFAPPQAAYNQGPPYAPPQTAYPPSGPPPYPAHPAVSYGGQPPPAMGYAAGQPIPSSGQPAVAGGPAVGYPSQQPVMPPPQQPQPPQQPPAADAASVRQLRDMFPDFDETVLESVLASSEGNVENAINTLLSMA